MNIQSILKDITIDEALLHGLVGDFIDRYEKINKEQALEIREKMSERDTFEKAALKAASEAVTYSNLTVSIKEDEDFEDLLSIIKPSDDYFITMMRSELYGEGIISLIELTQPTEPEFKLIQERSHAAVLALSEKKFE